MKSDNSKIKFIMSRKGLYYIMDTSPLIGMPLKTGVFSQVALVKENLTNYTKRSMEQADKIKILQVTFNNISTKNLLKMINNNMVKDLPIMRQDIKLAEKMYGSNIYALKGKTLDTRIDHVVAPIPSIPKQT